MEKPKLTKTIIAVFTLIVLIQLSLFVFLFVHEKSSFHEDEYFSYALSNSYYRPFLYGSEHQKADNYNVWMKGSDFRHYIETTDGTRFKYGSVWSNQSEDVHPPLYYAIMHTISSIFPNRFSWWWGFVINLSCFVLTQIVILKLGSSLSGSPVCGLMSCFFWGFSLSCQNNQLFIRMYSMLTLFVFLFIYYSRKQFISDKTDIKHTLLPLFLIVLGGALVQHFFLIFAFFYTALQCLTSFCRKKLKNAVAYGCSVLAGVILSIAVFPATIPHLFSPDTLKTAHKPDFNETMHFFIRLSLIETIGKDIGFWYSSTQYYYLAGIVLFLIPVLGVIFLFRNEPKVRNVLSKISQSVRKAAVHIIKEADLTIPISIAAAAAYYCVLSARIPYFDFGETIDRYVFSMLAVFIVIITVVLHRIFSAAAGCINIKYVKRAAAALPAVIICIILGFQNFKYSDYRQYCKSAQETNGKISEYLADNDCLLVCRTAMYLPAFSEAFMNSDDVYISTMFYDDIFTQAEEISKFADRDEFYFFEYNTGKSDAILDLIKENTGYNYELCTEENIHNNTAYLYRFHK